MNISKKIFFLNTTVINIRALHFFYNEGAGLAKKFLKATGSKYSSVVEDFIKIGSIIGGEKILQNNKAKTAYNRI